MAADLVARQVDVIAVPGSAPATMAAKAATRSIPIIFQLAGDPVELGLVASLRRPDGNLTGVTSLNMEVAPKQLQLLHELVPSATVVGLLINETNPLAEPAARSLQAVAATLGLQMPVLHASDDRGLDAAFQTLAQTRAGGLVIGPDPFFTGRLEQLGALTSRHAIPAISPYREFAAADGLMSYGTDIADLYREAGVYTGRVLKGAKPADLPVQQATKVQLVINLKTAKALGLTVPLPLLGRADEVIE
jgi:putative ABC transport system substrate-binding protein